MEKLVILDSGNSKKLKPSSPFDMAVVFTILAFFSDPGTVSTEPLFLAIF